MKKRKHHYVWRNYLRSWANNEQIWCSREGSYFITNLMNIGQERDFYKLKKLSKENIQFIKALAIDPSPEHLKNLNQGWVDMFNFVFKIHDFADKNGLKNPELDKLLDECIHNLEEDLHTTIENSGIKFLKSIQNENLDFYKNDDDCSEFIHFICVQYIRTNNIKQSVAVAIKQSKLTGLDDIWNILSHIFATNMSWSLYADRKKFKIVLLLNPSEVSFITGDQPIINTHSTGKESMVPPDELEFYYPVSPSHAILLTESGNYSSREKVILSISEIEKYNMHIVKQSHNQLYSNSKTILKRYAA